MTFSKLIKEADEYVVVSFNYRNMVSASGIRFA